MSGIRFIPIFSLILITVCFSFVVQAQIGDKYRNFHWSIEPGDTIFQLDSISQTLLEKNRLYQNWSWVERHFFNTLNIKFNGKPGEQICSKIYVFQEDNSLTVELFFNSTIDLLSQYFGLIEMLNGQLKSYDKWKFYELDYDGRVHARGESYSCYQDYEQKNVLVYVEISELPSIAQMSSTSWKVIDNAKVVLRYFVL